MSLSNMNLPEYLTNLFLLILRDFKTIKHSSFMADEQKYQPHKLYISKTHTPNNMATLKLPQL